MVVAVEMMTAGRTVAAIRDRSPGPSAHGTLRGDRATAPLQHICVFRVSFARSAFQKGTRMRRIDLVTATMQGWARLDPAQRDQFFEAFVRLDRLELRAWLRRRLQYPPLAAVDPAAFTISDADIALLMKNLPLRADDADGDKIIP